MGAEQAEVFALLGVRPVWDEMSRRVVKLEVVDLAELGRPRIDVTVRIAYLSGYTPADVDNSVETV